MAPSMISQLVMRNQASAANHKSIPEFSEYSKLGLQMPRVLLVTCLDNRVQPERFLDLTPADGVLVMRNICGHIDPALRDILALDSFLTLQEIMIVHHTDCGSTHFTNELIRDVLKKRLPLHTEVDSMTFGAISDLEQSVKDDVGDLKSSPLIRKELADATFGFVFDMKTGLLSQVSA